MMRAEQSQCPDMQCSAAFANIYICRFGAALAVVVSVALLVLSVVYGAWMYCLWQKPWRFPNIHDAFDALGSTTKPPVLQLRARCDVGACPVCKVFHDRVFGPGQVCFWCDAARRAFFPFAFGMTSSVISLVLLFFFSLRPSFADWYFALLLLVPLLTYGLFVAYVMNHQCPVAGDANQRPTSFFGLALTLRFRHLSAIFDVPDDAAPEDTEPVTPPMIPSLMMEETMGAVDGAPGAMMVAGGPSSEAFHSDTMHMLELDTTVPAAFRNRLRDDLKHDEFIVWWEKPAPSQIHVDNRLLLHTLAIGVLIGVFLFLVGGLPAGEFPRVLLHGEALRFLGLIMFAGFGLILASVYSGAERVHVLTNKRLITLTNGLLGSVHPSVTALDHVGQATVWGFQELGFSVVGFAWETVDTKPRRLPRVGMTRFVGVQNVNQLLTQFREHAPTLKTKKAQSERNRAANAWRVHVFVNFALVVIAPIVLLASEILPVSLALFGLLLWWDLNGAIIQRGWRVLHTTKSPINHKAAQGMEWKAWNQQGFSVKQLFTFGRGRADRAPPEASTAGRTAAAAPPVQNDRERL